MVKPVRTVEPAETVKPAETGPPAATALAVIGAGPRGLGILERLIAHCLTAPFPVTVHVVDPRPPGAGFHTPGQPDHLLLNTVCSQLSVFPDAHMVRGPVPLAGPSLHAWCRERDLRVAEDGFTVRPGEGREIRPNDFLPRRLLSEYLIWAGEEILGAAPACLTLIRHRTMAVDVRPGAFGSNEAHRRGSWGTEIVVLADGSRFGADAVFVTVGHHALYLPAGPEPEPGLITRPYPLPSALDSIPARGRVAVLGTGLTAMDVITTLTLGRGGRHLKDGTGLRYVPSGREPVIVLANRSGTPARSRPRLNPGRVRFAPLALTEQRLTQLRTADPGDGARIGGRDAVRDGGRLDFVRDVLPLVVAEMELAYYRTLLAGETGDATEAGREVADRTGRVGHQAVLEELRARFGPTPVVGILSAGPASDSADPTGPSPAPALRWTEHRSYEQWFTDRVAEDLAEARAGLGASPLKEALEVLRDHRDVLRAAVDPPGLDSRSLAFFFGTFAPTVNRLVIGPQLERSAELLSLMAAGVVRIGPGPAPRVVAPSGHGPWRLESSCLERPASVEVDHVVHAHLASPAPDGVGDSLLGRLAAAGRVRTAAPLSGLDVTRRGQGVDRSGSPQQRLFFLGPHTEGSSYYNHYVPSPGAPSRALMDAELALSTALPSLIRRTR
ncbi:FAD/NAD(P)-binding protein [Streptomyces sp. NPDC006649]|uniref:FAD/NAD(P)-binding protein n=1 Tax=Streptomyces sp. NPDC006649 TaxID=3156896 RepID=UPI0033B48566